MSNQLANTERAVAPQPLALCGAGQRHVPESPLLLIRRYLRGRYLLAAATGLVLCVPCAVVGYFAVPPVYESSGLVHVAPTMPRILYETEENRPMPVFDSFVAAQATYLKSRRVLDMAVNNEKLLAAGWPAGSAGVSLLDKTVTIQASRGSELIQVTAKNRQPALAQLTVAAVLDSYDALKDELNGMAIEDREIFLAQRAKELDNERKRLQEESLSLAQTYGTDNLELLCSMQTELITKLKASIAERELEIARAGSEPEQKAEAPGAPSKGDALDLFVLAARDAVLRSLVEQRDRLRIEVKNLSAQFSPAHRTMIERTRTLAMLEEEVRDRAALVAQQPQLGPVPLGAGEAMSLKQLQASRDAQVKLLNKALEDMKAMSATRMSVRALLEKAAERKRELDEATTALDRMRVERQNIKGGRVTIAQRGDLPVSASSDRRRPLTMFGALFGLGLGVGLVWVYGFVRDGYRYVDDLQATGSSPPLLGIIPELSGENPEQSEDAALSVHHIRNMLQFQMAAVRGGRGAVFTVTSAMAGDGKTHLAMALGLSFAMAGRRTLLIDADLRGRGLTDQLGLKKSTGLSEAIHASTLNGEVHAAGANLFAIPAGTAEGFRAEQLSSDLLSRVLNQARESFDAIIVDTGPISGSLEANLAASLSDRVVLVVSRGQHPSVVQAALSRLRSVGGLCAGLVFNRAAATDFARSASVLSASRHVSRAPAAPASKGVDLVRVMERSARAEHEPGL